MRLFCHGLISFVLATLVLAGNQSCSGGREEDDGFAAPLQARFPWNGFATGSIHANAADGSSPLRPRFVWNAREGADHYQVQIDDSCEIDTFSTCEFDSLEGDLTVAETSLTLETPLEVSTEVPVGRRYYWRVRACAVNKGGLSARCSGWSETRYLNVGQIDNDFNGDGYVDLAAGTPLAWHEGEIGVGNVAVYLGGEGLPSTVHEKVLQNPFHQFYARFGNAVSGAGDLNADGFSDLVVGASSQDGRGDDVKSQRGEAYVFLGGPDGLPDEPSVVLKNPNDIRFDNFGASIAIVGDTNDDGYADFLVAASHATRGGVEPRPQSSVFLYPGNAEGTWTTESPTRIEQPPDYYYVYTKALGDLNGDGRCDFGLLSSKWDTFNENRRSDRLRNISVYLGTKSSVYSGTGITFESERDAMGLPSSLAIGSAGDANGDGFNDLFIGTSTEITENEDGDTVRGIMSLYLGEASGIGEVPTLVMRNPTTQSDAFFGGHVVNAGDVNGDGFDDLVVGMPSLTIDGATPDIRGTVYIFFGDGSGFPEVPDAVIDNPERGVEGSFGSTVVAAGDVNQDGFDDIWVRAFYEREGFRRPVAELRLILGGRDDIRVGQDIVLRGPPNESEAFGSSLTGPF